MYLLRKKVLLLFAFGWLSCHAQFKVEVAPSLPGEAGAQPAAEETETIERVLAAEHFIDQKKQSRGEQKAAQALYEKYLKEGAERGSAEAQRSLANLYFSRMVPKKKRRQAQQYYQLAADQGDAYAQLQLAAIYREKGNYQGAIRVYKIVAERTDIANSLVEEARHGLIHSYLDVGDLDKAERYLKRDADSGDTSAQVLLGDMYLNFIGNESMGKYYLRKAAEAGDCHAVGILHSFYQDEALQEEADQLLNTYESPCKTAADAGDVQAQHALGSLYDKNDDREEAERYYKLAADQGYPKAQYDLGDLYSKWGKVAKARRYLRMASDQKFPGVQAKLRSLNRRYREEL